MNTMFWLCIILMALAFGLVLVDWYCTYMKYAVSTAPNLVNRVFAFFCLAMLGSNVILVASGNYSGSLYLSSVVSLTEILFLCNSKVKQ